MSVTILEKKNHTQSSPNPEEVVILTSAFSFVLEEETEEEYAEYI